MLSDYLKVLGLQGGAALASLLGYWLISRRVEPGVFGQYSLWLSLVGAAGLFLFNWPNAALVRFGREEWRERGSLGETLGSRLLLYAAGLVAAAVLAAIFNPAAGRFLSAPGPLPWLLLGAAVMPLADLAIYAHQAVGRSLAYGAVPLGSKLIFLLGLGLIPAAGRPGFTYLAGWLLAGVAASALPAFLALPRGTWRRFAPRRETLGKIMRYSWALPFGAAAAYTVNWVDAWVIRAYMGTREVGLYTWAYQVTVLGGMLFSPLGFILTPGLVDARLEGDFGRLAGHARRSLGFMVLGAAAGTCCLGAVYPLLRIGVAEAYRGTYVVLLILLALIPFDFLGNLMNPVGNAFEFIIPRVVLIGMVKAAANALGDLALVPLLGIHGPALVTLAVSGLATLATAGLIKRQIPGFPSLLPFALAGLVMPLGALCLFLTGPAAGAAACLFLGAGVLLAARRLGIFTAEDVESLRKQAVPELLRRPLTVAATWLARGSAGGGGMGR